MTIEGIVFMAVLGTVMLLLTALSLMSNDNNPLSVATDHLVNTHDRETIEERLNMLLDSIRDLDIDFDMNKITPEVYAEQRKMLLGRAVGVLHRLEQLTRTADSDKNLEVEAAILAFRSQLDAQN